MRFLLIFLVLFMVTASNLDEGMVASLGMDPDIIKVALLAFVLTGLTLYHNLALMVLVIALAVMANLPQEVLEGWGVDRTVVIATLVVMVLAPRVQQWLDG